MGVCVITYTFLKMEKQEIKGKTKKELSHEYEYSQRTISRMCEEIGIFTKKRRLSAKEVKKFYENFGLPILNVTNFW